MNRHIESHSSRLRVLLIAPQPFYEDRGTPIAVHQTLVALSKLGFKVDLATFPVGSEVDLPNVRIVRTANPLCFRSVPIGFSFQKIVLDLCLLFTVLRLARRKNYICAHGVEEGAGLALVCKVLFGTSVVYDMQSSIPEQLRHVRGFRRGPGRWLALLFERWLVKGANSIIASSGLKQRVLSIQPEKKVFECAFEGCNPTSKNEELAGRLGILNRPTVVYTGNFAPYQGLEKLLDAAILVRQELPEVAFVLVGGTGPEISRLNLLVEARELTNNVQLIQRQPRENMPDYLALANVLVLARSNAENTPLKLFDYLKGEKPIVATDIPAHRAILSEKTAILVAPTANALARGILLALKNNSYTKKIAPSVLSVAESGTNMTLQETIAEAYNLIRGSSV
jgi:glycosyltransferase involved in cell wall biosynthesis